MFPKELLLIIFANCTIKQLHNCETVCKLWYRWMYLCPELYWTKYTNISIRHACYMNALTKCYCDNCKRLEWDYLRSRTWNNRKAGW